MIKWKRETRMGIDRLEKRERMENCHLSANEASVCLTHEARDEQKSVQTA